MNWLLQYGDTDILREATNPSAVFWHRARQGGVPLIVAGALTALLLLIIVLLVLGPEGTGVPWLMREWLAVTVSILAIIWAGFCGWQIFQYMPSRNDRVVILLRQWVRQYVDPLEEQLQALADHELRNRTEDFRQRIAAGESIESIRPEAYACVREASRRARAHRQFECQLIGGKVLEECNVAEMRTGEGKTIVCYMANYMKVLQGKRVHMVTVNDYLVKRDAEFARSIFELLGVTVGHISSDMETYGPGAEERRTGYACDITYGTNSEFGFDYLRDNMKHSVRDQVQGPQDYVVVDEVDSILIDEARTPLIISGPAHDDVTNYRRADDIARQLVQLQEQANRETRSRLQQIENNPTQLGLDPNEPKYREGLKKFKADPFWLSSDEADAMGHKQYFVVEADRKSVHMTEHGAKAAQQALGIGTFYDSKNMNWPHYIDNALRAHKVYQKDKEYVVQEDQITIVDEFTGRLMHGRQWSDGLHQAVEAKERVTIKQETQTLATITLQNLFKLYGELAGMTGTAMTEQDEFMKIYQLEVIAIPTNMPIRRIDYNDKIYKTDQNKLEAIVEEIRSYSQDGFPSDPHSVVDALKHAQRTLKSLKDAGRADDSVDQQLQTIHDAIREFRNGDGDEEAPARGYRKLMGADVGGRPVLVGTVSVESSERLSELLHRRYGIEHEVLNAKNHAREADIVAKAGQQQEVSRGKKTQIVGNVTISTNMAGRGTDIRLGEGVPALGGLHVVGTERHESRRIDNQLRGRCGRQGDPGSSRFFLSFDDELLRLFMGEWVLKMLGMLGYQEGMAIEDRRVSNGIEKAQKKVEERNFHIRKNLLEYDEVMDYQRKTFYSMRQRVVEGRNLSEFIWEEIHATVADAVNRYYDPQYPAQCVVEWANQNLGVMLDPGKLDATYADRLTDQVRDMASNEVRLNVQRTFGEYVDRDTPPEDWDVRGLTAWAAQFGLNLTQNQVRKGDPDDLLEQITTAAQQRIEEQNLTAIETFVDADYGKSQLVRWAQEKFDIAVSLEDLAQANRQEAEEVLNERIRHAYKQREIEYPVAAVLDYALQRGGSNINEVGNIIARWANRKYSLNWTYEHFTGKNPDQIFRELRSVAEDYLTNGKLAGEIDDAVTRLDHEQLPDWARERFGAVVDATPIEPDGDIRQQLERYGYEMLRYELTQLERYVLLTTFDQVWKDHMYQMDLLRHSIGLRGYAEQDPKIAYKREGTRMFNEMLENIRERVTDLIFKVRIAGSAAGETESTSGTAAFTNMTAAKADATNAGFSTAEADQQAAMRQQGEGGQAQTIRRAEPKVGRNDPCPCGSGKKYKQCCGKPR